MFNPFLTNVPLLYPLKTSENLRFSDDFRGYRRGTLVENGLTRSFKDPSANKYMLKFKFVQIKKQTNKHQSKFSGCATIFCNFD